MPWWRDWRKKTSKDKPVDSGSKDKLDLPNVGEEEGLHTESSESGKSKSVYGLATRNPHPPEAQNPSDTTRSAIQEEPIRIRGSRESFSAADVDAFEKPGIYQKLLPSKKQSSYLHPLDKLREEHSILVTENGNKYLLMHTFDGDEWRKFIAEFPQYTNIGKPHKDKNGKKTGKIKLIGGEGNQGVFRIAREINPVIGPNAYELGDYLGMKKTRSTETKNDAETINEAKREAKLILTRLMRNTELANVIVPSHDYIRTENTKGKDAVYLFMQIAQTGVDFASHVATLPKVERDQAILIAANQLLVAVATLHSHGIYHGDLKLDNTFFVNRRLRLGDFGAAKTSTGNVGERFATDYAPPEYYFGITLAFEEYDSWATGFALLELCGANISEAFKKTKYDFWADIQPIHKLWEVAVEISKNNTPLTPDQEKDYGIKLPEDTNRSLSAELIKAQRVALYARAEELQRNLKGRAVYQEMITDLINNTNIPDALKPTISHLLDFNKDQRFRATEALHLFQNNKNNENWLLENPDQNIESTAEDFSEANAHTKLLITAQLLKKVETDNSDIDKNNKPKRRVFYLNIEPKDIVINKESEVKIATPPVDGSDLLLFKLDNMNDYIYCPPQILLLDQEEIANNSELLANSTSAWSLGITLLKLYDVDLSEFTKGIVKFASALKKSDFLVDTLTKLNEELSKLDLQNEDNEDSRTKQKNIQTAMDKANAEYDRLLLAMLQSKTEFKAILADILNNKLTPVPESVIPIIKSLLEYDAEKRATISQALANFKDAEPVLFAYERQIKADLLKSVATHRQKELSIEVPVNSNLAPTADGGESKGEPNKYATIVKNAPTANGEMPVSSKPKVPEVESGEVSPAKAEVVRGSGLEQPKSNYTTTAIPPKSPPEETKAPALEKSSPIAAQLESSDEEHAPLTVRTKAQKHERAQARKLEIEKQQLEKAKGREREIEKREKLRTQHDNTAKRASTEVKRPEPVVEKESQLTSSAPTSPSVLEKPVYKEMEEILGNISKNLSQTAEVLLRLAQSTDKSFYSVNSPTLYHAQPKAVADGTTTSKEDLRKSPPPTNS